MKYFKVACMGIQGLNGILTPKMGVMPESMLKRESFDNLIEDKSIIEIEDGKNKVNEKPLNSVQVELVIKDLDEYKTKVKEFETIVDNSKETIKKLEASEKESKAKTESLEKENGEAKETIKKLEADLKKATKK